MIRLHKYQIVFGFLLLLAVACQHDPMIDELDEEIQEPVDTTQSGPLSILDVDDSNIPESIRDLIYSPGAGTFIVHTEHPKYNETGKTVVIPFELTDYPWNTAITYDVIEESFFGENTGSFSDYFNENSYGQFKLTNGGISDVVSIPYTLADWWASGLNEPTYTLAMNSSTIDWPSLDTNGDFFITLNEAMIVLIYPFGGSGATRYYTLTVETPVGTYTVNNSYVLIDVKRNDDPDKANNPILFNTHATHELCHGFFYLPDRYGVTGYCTNGETGPYDPMSTSCEVINLSPFDKMKIGWLKPKILEIPSHRISGQLDTLAFPASESTAAALIFWTEDAPDEFFIVENRHKTSSNLGFDNGLPDEGIGVWWSKTSGYNLHFVHALNLGIIPQEQNYDGSVWDHNGFFKYHPGDSLTVFPLQNNDGVTRFTLQNISETDTLMTLVL